MAYENFIDWPDGECFREDRKNNTAKEDDALSVLPIFRRADRDALNQDLLPEVIEMYAQGMMIAGTRECVEYAAEQILRHAENSSDVPRAIAALILTNVFLPSKSRLKQPARDKLDALISKTPEVEAQRKIWKDVFPPAP